MQSGPRRIFWASIAASARSATAARCRSLAVDALTHLMIYRNDGLQALGGLAQLKKLEELRLQGAFLPAALAEVAKLPALRRLMLPTDLEGVKLARPADLPPVEMRFARPGLREWWEWGGG